MDSPLRSPSMSPILYKKGRKVEDSAFQNFQNDEEYVSQYDDQSFEMNFNSNKISKMASSNH